MTTHGETGHDAASSEGTVTVEETSAGGYTQQIAAGHHRLVADEPRPIGDDLGPTPYDLLLAGLGACTSMTVRMYANRKGWPLERIRVTLRHSRIHAKDCAECETSAAWIDHIDRDVELIGEVGGAALIGTAQSRIDFLLIPVSVPRPEKALQTISFAPGDDVHVEMRNTLTDPIIDGHEGACALGRGLVDRPGNQFLARPRFACN